jgi:hypothetical protein
MEHGAWVFLFSPLLIGMAAGGVLRIETLVLVIGAVAAFLLRQPMTITVKAWSGRRQKSDFWPAMFWLVVYGMVGISAVGILATLGYGAVLYLAVPGVPVLGWHLWLVSRRAERRQVGVEIVAAGALALTAPAAYWVGTGNYSPVGWLLWALCWGQIAGSILYTYLRLQQRRLKSMPPLAYRLKMARNSIAYHGLLLALVAGIASSGIVPPLVSLAFALPLVENIWGGVHPAVQAKPTAIGVRQLIVSSLFTLIFILAWI